MCVAFSSSAFAAMTNVGVEATPVFEGNQLTEPTGGFRGLYCPSEADDPTFRSQIAAATGGTWDYFDATAGVPSFAGYNCVMTWVNFAMFDAVAMGNALADFVDAGGTVVLGAFCTYTSGNPLSGRIMTVGYAPVNSPGGTNKFFFDTWSGDFPDDCIHQGVSGAYGATFRDVLALQGAGAVYGTFFDGNIAQAANAGRTVHYANGAGGLPIDGNGPLWAQVVANGCACSGGTATESSTWGQLKDLYR
jgi:hypothetical protein